MKIISSHNLAEPRHTVHAHQAIEPAMPTDDDVDARMATIKEILAFAGMPLLERYSLVAEWVHHAEAKLSVFGQHVHKPKGGRPEGGAAKASRELCVPGQTVGARRKFVERAVKINALRDEVKEAARAAGLDNTQCALLAIAAERSLDAQIARVREIATRKAAPRRTSRPHGGGDNSGKTVATSADQTRSDVGSSDPMLVVLEKLVESPPTAPPDDGSIPPFLSRRAITAEEQSAFDGLIAAWVEFTAVWERASRVVRARFEAEVLTKSSTVTLANHRGNGAEAPEG